MLISYLRLTLRTLAKNKIAFFINLAGMSIALACCIAAYVNYEFNVGFDKQQINAKSIYRVAFEHESEGKTTPYGVIPIPMAGLIMENFTEVDNTVRYISKNAIFKIGDEMFEKEFVYADPSFTEMFNVSRLAGTVNLKDKSHVLISERLAKAYFGDSDPLGKGMTQMISGTTRDFVVGGVFSTFAANSSFKFDILTTFDNYFLDAAQQSSVAGDWKKWTTTFIYLKDPSSVNAITARLQQYVKPQNEARTDLQAARFYIEPFVGMAQRAVRERNQGHWLNMPMPPAAVVAPFVMAAFILLVACFNFTNNAIAIAGNRLKEIGIRKVIGGRRKELILQFLSETTIFCLIAFGVALFVAEYFVEGWESMWPGLDLAIRYQDNLPFLASLAALIIGTALLAGSYPALYVSSFRPIQILRGKVKFGGTGFFTKTLLVLQFSISLAAVIFAIAFYFNAQFQKSYDLGYSYQSVIQVPVDGEEQFVRLKTALEENPMFTSVGGTEQHIYSSAYQVSIKTEKQTEKEVDALNIGDNYFKTLNVRLVAGREFGKDRVSDVRESIIVNEEFVRTAGLPENPIGQRIVLNDTSACYIIGVVKGVYLEALFQPLSPVVFRYVPADRYNYLVASVDNPIKLVAGNEAVLATWKKLFPTTLYTGRLMEERMVAALQHFDNVVILYTFLGIVAIIMSVSGLYSLVTLNLQKRTKELGIRKILGAPLTNIVAHSSRLFVVILMASFLVGSLAGSFMVNKLMDSVWEYYEAVNFTVIAFAVGILLIIATLTVLTRVLRTSLANPVDTLRSE